jgi:sarcosine oxidase, subunit beta
MPGIERLDALPPTAELVIVGGGVMGAATAFAARRAGLRPLVLEAFPAPASGTTAVATGAYRLQHDDPDELELARETVAALRDFASFTGQDRYGSGLVANGRVHATTTDQGAAAQRALLERQAKLGVTGVELVDGAAARERFGFLGPAVRQIRYRAEDGVLDPKQASLGLLEGASAPLVTDCRATGFEVAGGRLAAVRTTRGTVAAGACVIAAGPMSGAVARLAGVELPLQVLRRHKVVLPDVPEVPADAPLVYDDDTGAHWRPAYRGAVVLAPDADDVTHEPSLVPTPDPAFPYAVLDPASPASVARTTPFWGDVWRDGRAAWSLLCGLYTMTPDHRPLLGATPVPGLFVNTGYSGHGVMMSIAGARAVVAAVTDGAAGPFRPDRAFVPVATRPL